MLFILGNDMEYFSSCKDKYIARWLNDNNLQYCLFYITI